jgi:hypothetical protein
MLHYVWLTLLHTKQNRQGEEGMSFHQRTVTVSLVIFSLILGLVVIRVVKMIQTDTFTMENVVQLWGIVLVLAVIGTIVATILTQIGSGIVQAARTGEEPKLDDIQDERDKIIDLRGTRVTYLVTSLGGFFAMLTFVLGQSPLVMFSLLLLFGVLGQVVGDLARLYLYRRGF